MQLKSPATSTETLNQLSAVIGRISSSLYMWIVIFCVLGGVLRFIALDRQGLWSDELHSVEVANRGLLATWLNSRVELHPPLYYALLSVLLRGLPPTEANARLLSAISSLVAIPVLGIYLARNYGRTAAIVGMLFLTISPVQIYYAQEARAYAISVLWVGISLLTIHKVEHQPSARIWLIYSVVAILGIYLNYFLSILVFAQITWLGLQPSLRRQKWFFISLLLIAIVCSPLVPNAIASQWALAGFNSADSAGRFIGLPSTFESMLIGDTRYVPRPARWAVLGIFLLSSLAGIAQLKRRQSILYLLMIGLPTIIVFALLPQVGLNPPHYQEKQFIVLAPVAWVLAAVGISFLWQSHLKYARAMAITLCAGWIFAAGLALGWYFGGFVKSDEQVIVNWLKTEQADRQAILIVGPPGIGGALKYYAPETHFLSLKRWDYADPLWTSDQEFVMFPPSPPAKKCILANLQSSQDFWVVEYIWLDKSASFVHSVKQIRVVELTAQIGNWQIYYVPAVPGGDKLRCEEIRYGSGEY